jgi:hypothetical protein
MAAEGLLFMTLLTESFMAAYDTTESFMELLMGAT